MLAAIKKAGIEPDEAQIGKYAENTITLEGAKAQQMLKLIEALEDHDDVQNVWANFDVSDKELEERPPRASGPVPGAPSAAMIILGVDPGSLRTGYGVIETDGRRHRLVEKGVLACVRASPCPSACTSSTRASAS